MSVRKTSGDRHRSYVAAAYARALAEGARTSPGAVHHREGGAAYGWQELALLPEAAKRDSFASGNPLAFAELGEADRLLDLGCGAGLDLLLAARRMGPAARVVGLDLTAEMVTRARANAAAAGLASIFVAQALIEQVPVMSGSMDWVLSNGVVSLCIDASRALGEAARVLRPQGRAAMADVIVSDRPGWLGCSRALAHSCLAGALSGDEWTNRLASAGFDAIQTVDVRAWEREEIAALIHAEAEAYTVLGREAAAHNGDEPAPVAALLAALATGDDNDAAVVGDEAAAALAGQVYTATFLARRG